VGHLVPLRPRRYRYAQPCLHQFRTVARARLVAGPLQYLEIVAATALGYWIFSDLPNALSFAGIALIVASGLYVFFRERQLEKQLERKNRPVIPP